MGSHDGITELGQPQQLAAQGQGAKTTPNSVHRRAVEIVYGIDISGRNENIYNTWVQIVLMGRYIIKAGQSCLYREDYYYTLWGQLDNQVL